MSAFIAAAPDTIPPERDTLTNEDWFPDLSLSNLREIGRIDGTVTGERLRELALYAAMSINARLREFRAGNEGAGFPSLAAVPSKRINGESRLLVLYRRAVACLLKADVMERYPDFDSTGTGSMNKPASLRAHLAHAIPELQRSPESLLVFVEDGSLISSAQRNESFELRYRLSLVLVDFVGDANRLFLAVLRWIAVNQRELIANPDRRSDIAFEVDVIDHERADVEIRLPLTERIGVETSPNGDDRITPWPEPRLIGESWDDFGPVP